MEEEGLEQMVDFSTHTKGNILDLVITNCPEKIVSVSEEGRLGKSDHCVILLEVECELRVEKEEKTGKNWKKANMTGLCGELRNINWNSYWRGKNTEESWQIFRQRLNGCIDKFVPSFTNSRKKRPPWLHQSIVQDIRAKKKAWKAWRLSRTEANHARYEELRKKVTKRIRGAKREMERDLAQNRDKQDKKFTRYIKSKTKTKSTIGPLENSAKARVTSGRDMAELLNSQFCSVFTEEDLTHIPVPKDETEGTEKLRTVTITREDVKKQINNLRKDAAPGPDGITPALLKNIRDEVAGPLCHIFNKSLTGGQVPGDWKTATVIPIFKKGQKKEPANYRPVSLTSIPCKMMEAIIKNRIMEHLTENNLLRDSQHGFQKGKSCATNLILTMEYLTKANDAGVPVDLIYLDFSKAFDKVPHRRLLEKCRAKGIDGETIRWLEDWLTNRTQTVKVENETSEEAKVKSGVPQGTILGPCLFNIYIDDIDDCVKPDTNIEDQTEKLAEILKFADDTKAFRTVTCEEDRDKLQLVLDKMCAWAQKWGMAFNTDKCKVMHIGHNNKNYQYTMHGKVLDSTDAERDLGVVIEKSLKPSSQCKKAAARARVVLGQITRNFHYRDKKHFIRLYTQYVRPHLEFASSAWAPWTAADIQTVEKVQEQALRFTHGLKGGTYQERCAEVGLETLEKRRWIQDMMQVFKILKGKDKVCPDKLFTRVDHTTGTRMSADQMNLKKRMAKKDVRLNSFSVRVVDKWNRIPEEVKKLENPASFKKYLKKTQYP